MDYSFLKIKNKNTIVFLICLGISAFLWLLIKLSQEYEINVNIPVKYHNYPEDQILINKPDSVIQIRITDNGFDLIGTSLFGSPSSLELNIPEMTTSQINAQIKQSYSLVRTKIEELNKIFSSAKNLRLLGPDSLVLKFEKLATKEVTIFPNIKYLLLPQFQLKGAARLQPQIITLYGSQNKLDLIDTVYTESKTYTELDLSFKDQIKLLIPSNVNTKVRTSELIVEVEKFTEAKITIPIPQDFIDNKNIRLFPKHIEIKYAVSFEKFNEIKPEGFKVIAAIDPLNIGKLNISLESFPDDIRVIDFSPKVAEFIIIK
ncbi:MULTISPECIES: hypothetical protein [unclassified Lentimicrobium]|uniref:hypothetical protein n=1 Tax=unclassified Lentimicrobium TaxID=2677434 RepID=UPI0015580E2B|nr:MULTISPECIES: hypothetical protein [unclassified Lentimicrobium]NPD44336.1 hypothetical protein [Lentimicrobium sp. S6]NPD86896.1 hypothetical protein [Lentimicrobium sp. L6]